AVHVVRIPVGANPRGFFMRAQCVLRFHWMAQGFPSGAPRCRKCTVLAHHGPPQYDGIEAMPAGMRYSRACNLFSTRKAQWHSACLIDCRTPNAQRIRLLSDNKSGA